MPYVAERHAFAPPPELRGVDGRYPVVIVGAGPVGMAMALDLAQHGVQSVVLERGDTIGTGSKAICWSKRTLEIFDRLGTGARMLEKGITWNVGKVFVGDDQSPRYQFDLLPEDGHCFPAFVNLQQYYVEEYLVDALQADPLTELRWLSEVVGITQDGDGASVDVETPDGSYSLSAEYVLAADGSHSPVRSMLGLEFEGRVFQDHFLIADLKMKGEFPSERWFWFDPPNDIGTSALLHKQADDVWRTDYQLGWDIDRDEELKPENVARRVRGLLGPDRDFSFEWISIYTFACRRIERFVHGRVIFIGDSAHLVSPFGARGGNGGIQDIDNLGWKLALVLAGKAGDELIESYNTERVYAADENILNSGRATDFMTPKNAVSGYFRRAVLDLAADFDFAQKMVNSGRLSRPATLDGSPLNSADDGNFDSVLVAGAPAADAPIERDGIRTWLLRQLGGRFTALVFEDAGAAAAAQSMRDWAVPVELLRVGPGGDIADVDGRLAERYDAKPGTTYLFRPDQHVAARFRRFDIEVIAAARDRCLCLGSSDE